MTKEEASKYYDDSVTPNRYWDKNGKEIKAGSFIMLNGRKEKVYLLEGETRLGTDATNPKWLETGRAVPCEFGCYELTLDDLINCEVIENEE